MTLDELTLLVILFVPMRVVWRGVAVSDGME